MGRVVEGCKQSDLFRLVVIEVLLCFKFGRHLEIIIFTFPLTPAD
jgi:hypothetical protein